MRHNVSFAQRGTSTWHLQNEHIRIEFHRLLGVGDLNGDMVASLDLDCHHAPAFLVAILQTIRPRTTRFPPHVEQPQCVFHNPAIVEKLPPYGTDA